MAEVSHKYQWLRDEIASLPRSRSGDARELVWADRAQTIAFSRDPDGNVELFIVAAKIEATLAVVRERLEFREWTAEEPTPRTIQANRLVLPSAPHFDAFAAFVCAEMFKNGAVRDPHGAFARSEQAIALGLKTHLLAISSLLGLIGGARNPRVLPAASGLDRRRIRVGCVARSKTFDPRLPIRFDRSRGQEHDGFRFSASSKRHPASRTWEFRGRQSRDWSSPPQSWARMASRSFRRYGHGDPGRAHPCSAPDPRIAWKLLGSIARVRRGWGRGIRPCESERIHDVSAPVRHTFCEAL